MIMPSCSCWNIYCTFLLLVLVPQLRRGTPVDRWESPCSLFGGLCTEWTPSVVRPMFYTVSTSHLNNISQCFSMSFTPKNLPPFKIPVGVQWRSIQGHSLSCISIQITIWGKQENDTITQLQCFFLHSFLLSDSRENNGGWCMHSMLSWIQNDDVKLYNVQWRCQIQ